MTENLGLSLSVWTVIPFAGLLLTIAFFPLWSPVWWEKHKNKGLLSLLWAIPIAALFLYRAPMELVHVMKDYASFIILLGSLYIISGGIYLEGDLEAKPKINTLFLLIGAVLANFIGTTGASMLLIRPLLQTNIERKNITHIPIFFIFLVSNIGGCLTPLGDPPLFMGYLKGVPFFWTLKLFPEWIFMVVLVLAVFYIFDTYKYKSETREAIALDESMKKPLKVHGGLNFLWLSGVILGVGLKLDFPAREGALLLMCALSLLLTKKEVRVSNRFTYNGILEVAILFAGIFITMVPVILILNSRAGELGIREPWQFFWTAGALSSFLDNTPTYIAFFSLAQGLNLGGGIMGIPEAFLKAISLGAVFMGANSYIGNGPNFMVKVIAEEYKIKMPSFVGYMAYSGIVLIPLYIAVTLVFFR